MDYGNMLRDSFTYTKDALWGHWGRWILLIISAIIFPFIYGYGVRIMSGAKPAPELENGVELFIDGIKLLVINIIYAIPIALIGIVGLLAFLVPAAVVSGPGSQAGYAAGVGIAVSIIAFLAFFVLAILISMIIYMASVRFAKTGSVGEAFNVRAIAGHIGQIGWLDYFVALVVMVIVLAIVEFVIALIPFIGPILLFVLIPAFFIFSYRYLTLVYESVPAPA
jgi:hypothetical protein